MCAMKRISIRFIKWRIRIANFQTDNCAKPSVRMVFLCKNTNFYVLSLYNIYSESELTNTLYNCMMGIRHTIMKNVLEVEIWTMQKNPCACIKSGREKLK